jgi:hypothetical protein
MMDSTDPGADGPAPLQNVRDFLYKAQRQQQAVLDKWTPFTLHRWLGTAGLVVVFMLRIVLAQGVSVKSILETIPHNLNIVTLFYVI